MIGNVRRYWQPSFVIDDAQVAIGRRTYEGYVVQHACLRGMSGGPVFDPHGRVRGMAAATLTRTVPDPGGSPTVLQNGVVVGVEHIRRFVEAFRFGRQAPESGGTCAGDVGAPPRRGRSA
jgi:hypothetical protein